MTNLNFKSIILTLVTLLTLGVGQMWAATYILGPDGSWTENTAHQMASSGITNWVYKSMQPTGQWNSFKVKDGSTWYGKDSGSNDVTVGTVYSPTTSGGDIYCNFSQYSSMPYYFFFNTSTHKFMIQPNYYLAGTCGVTDHNWVTNKNTNTYDATNGYFKWNTCSLTAGTKYEFKLTNGQGTAWTYTFADWSGVTVTQGTKNSENSGNIEFTPTYGGTAVITFDPTNNNMVVHCPYQVSYNKGANGTGTNTTASKTWKTSLTLAGATFSRAGYTQDGWSTVDGGAKVYNLSGSYTTDADVTLYPHWTENMSSVSLVASPTGKGSFTIGGAAATSTTAGVTTTRSVTAVPISGYHFVSWSITGGATISSPTTNPTTVTGGGAGTAATLTATFAADDVYSLTVAAGTGISAVTGSTNDIKAAQNIAITATVATGYTWSIWTKTGAGTLSTFTAGTKNQTVTVGTAGDITLTASATENMSSLSTSCHYDAGNPSYAAPTVSNSATNVGYVTTRTITATAAGTGYTFAGWTLTNCTRTDGGAANATQITIRSNGDGAAATVVANYEEDRSSRWHLVGLNETGYEIFPDGWNVSNTSMMQKASGHSTESVVYASVTVSSKRTYLFKIVDDNGASDDIWYGYSTGDTYLEWTNTSTKNVYSGDGNGNNLKFTPTLLGTYEFKVDYSGTYPAVTITYPEIYAISGSFNDWTETSNLVFDGNVGTATINISANATAYEFKVLDNGSWCGASLNITGNVSNQQLTVGGGDNITLNADVYPGGNYIFTYNKSTHQLSVSYPTSYTVESEVGNVKGNAHEPEIYHTSYTPANKIASGTKVAAGTMVKFVVASSVGSAAKAGYTWWGFYNNAAGTGSTPPQKYTDGSVTTYTIDAISANAHVYEVFGENNYTVKIYNNGNGDVYEGGSIVTATTAHVATASNTLTATPQTGYYFTGWDQFSDSLTINSPSTAATTIKIKDTKLGNNARLRANYSPQWSVLGSGAFGGWEAFDAHLFDNYAVVSSKNVGYNTITLAANTNYEIKVYDRKNSTWYGGTANQDIDYEHSGDGNEYTIATTSSPKSVFIQSAAGGSYTLNWNLTDKKIAVVYPTSWYITTGQNDEDGGSFTAVDNSSNNVKGGKFVADNATVTFTASKNTGYNFGGWYSESTYTTAYTAGTNVSLSGDDNSILTLSSITANKEAYAKFTAKTYTITLSRSGEGYSTGGDATATATFNATLPAVTLPTAANGYAFMGYYSGENGTGTQFMNASGTWATDVTDTISSSKWVLDAGATLYAYFKKAEITGITLSPGATVAPSTDVTPTTVTATPTVSPTPVAPTKICWKLLRDNGNPITPQPTFSPGVDNAVTFPAPKVSGSYKVACVLRTGSECGAGTVLDSVVADLVVAGEHTVTIQYQDGDGRTLKDTIHITGKPLEWTTLDDITPPTITGYTFARWDAGDGITIKNGDSDPVTTTTTSSIQIKAIYDGTLTAVYTKKRMIYFYNNLGWESVYVYFYKNDSYWQIVSPYNGSGANTTYTWTNTPYSEGLHGQMQPVSVGSNIYYFDVEAAGVNASYDDVVFTEDDQHGEGYFRGTKAVRRGDYKSSMPMFVPLTDQTPEMHNGTEYTSNGYWMNYPENSGYTLKIYDNVDADKASGAIKSYAFPYSGDLIMPLKIDVEFTDGYNHDYWFMVYRNDGTYMGNTYHFKQGWNDKQIISGGNNKSKITTSAPGKYKFTLTYHDNGSGTVNYYIDVDFPIADGDYRIVYTDNATWSQDAHGASWNHPSDVISKAVDAKKDTVSFFVSKGDGITPAMKFQKASVTNEGVVTWSDVAGGSITIPSSITTSGVYNFIVSQPEGGASISLEKVEPYTGNFYIRTDCAGNTKWDSFKNIDHLMTYSEFAKDNSGFTHYYAHWVTTGQSVKFTIANDYSMCISDTLIQDYGTAIADIDGVGILESGNASIRFMWDQATNKISRAYISGSSTISDRFLVLEGDSRLFDENGDAYSISGLYANEVNLIDDQNFVYERIIKVQPGAQAKLTAMYNGKVQYFQGGSGSTSADSIILLGGKASVEKYDMRIVYDFKTNRLIRAYQPSGTIDDSLAINADMMIVREHHDAGNQLIFGNEYAKLSEVKTVYGVMRFNRWTLNNKDKSSHSALPVSEQKSSIWRGLYWISFPFDVNLSDVFGFGTYGTDWIIMYYDGAGRAEKGYWADSKSFWTYIWNRRGVTLKAGEGYVLALELPNMKSDNTDFWKDGKEQIELFFPSADEVKNIQQTTVDITVASHECTIDRRTDKSSGDANKDRTIADSHWNVIGVPSYANYGTTLKDGSGATITWNSNPATQGLPFLYEWNANDNTYTAQSGSTYNFKSMHSYIVQYTGTLRWLLASATPSSIVARRTYSEAPQSVEFRLELQQDDEFIDQTFVKMSNDEEVSAAFAFGEDMTKEFNGSKSNIYTLIENYLPTAGNTLPISESITIVPVGIKIKADGDYTFAIPDGTDGVGITLVDEETGIRTNLSLLNYNVYLEAGTYNNRFYLEISPVRKTPTSLEGTQSNDTNAKVRKVLINDILYIVKDGMIFDAHGARVQ